MLPNLANSDSRQAVSSVEDVNIRLNALCLRYNTKIQICQYPYIPTTGRTSKHSGGHIIMAYIWPILAQ